MDEKSQLLQDNKLNSLIRDNLSGNFVMIGGIPIDFPYQPYTAQFSIMNMVFYIIEFNSFTL